VGVLPRFFRDGPGELGRIAHAHPGAIPIVQLGPARIHLVTKPEHVQHVLCDDGSTYGKGESLWRALRRLVGNGLAAAEGEVWQQNRRRMQPLFSPKHLDPLVGTMAEIAERFAEPLASGAGRLVHVRTEMLRVTQAVVLATIFGADVDRIDAEALGGAITDVVRALNVRMFLYSVPEWIPLPGDAAMRRGIEQIDAAVLGLVEDRRRSGEARNDLLGLLLRARDDERDPGMDDRQLRDELVTFFVAGHETTAMNLTWTWHLLGEHPEVDRRMREEIASVLGGRTPTAGDLPRLAYTRRVLQESMRLYPPSWITARVARRDDEIDGHLIPAGATILLSQYITHHDPELWDDPGRFDPDRFLPERTAGRHRYAYWPFGGGPRQCIGNAFSLMEGQIILATWASRVRLRRAPGRGPVVPRSAGTLQPKGELSMTVERV
jgi:cytochrome P450